MIPETKLETWANRGASATAEATHTSIRTALEHENSPIADRILLGEVEIYLQGSYRNHTNIYADSDVDIVVELNATFGHNANALPPEQKRLHEASYTTADYQWAAFRQDVITALTKYYRAGTVDTAGKKAIKLLAAPGRLKADIVPAVKYRKYSHFRGISDNSWTRGIKFYNTATNQPIINYPHRHYDAGVDKHANRTNQWFKPTVRIFKNARTYLMDRNMLGKDKAPSYFLQNLIYNVPDGLFGTNYQTTVYNVLKHLYENPTSGFQCQHGQHALFGTTPEQWNEADAHETIRALVNLWDNWATI